MKKKPPTKLGLLSDVNFLMKMEEVDAEVIELTFTDNTGEVFSTDVSPEEAHQLKIGGSYRFRLQEVTDIP